MEKRLICEKCGACACNECFKDGKCRSCGHTARRMEILVVKIVQRQAHREWVPVKWRVVA